MSRTRLLTAIITGLAVSTVVAARQPAANPTVIQPPTLNVAPGSGPGVMPMIWGLLFLGFILGSNLLPVKRGHQD